MRRFGVLAVSCIVLAGLSLGGCNMTTPSQVNTTAIQVEDYMKTTLLPAWTVDKTQVDIAAGDYRNNSKSAPALVVPYLKGKKGALQDAMRVGAGYKKAFAEFGMNDLRVHVAVTNDVEGARNAVLAYTATQAHAPKNCMRMPGAKGTESQHTTNRYTMGCEHSILLAKMISRPSDLLGVAGSPDSYSRREGPMMEGYMAGRSNPVINGNTAAQGVAGGLTSAGQTTMPTQ